MKLFQPILFALTLTIVCPTFLTAQAEAANEMLSFMKEHPENSAISMYYNGELIKEHRANQMMPLASTVKVMIALEFSYQIMNGKINKEENIPLLELERYYVPNSDGNAHINWVKSLNGVSSTSLMEIAKGMIQYSSNANTEYLLDRIGIEQVNKRIETLGYVNHDPLYYPVSALFISQEMFPIDKTINWKVKKVSKLSTLDYSEACRRIHHMMNKDIHYSKSLKPLHFELQKTWSDRLPSSTTGTYADLMQKLNSKKYFPEKVQENMDELLEGVMQSKKNQKWLTHAGMKGGSTPIVLTKASYATDKKGNRMELVYFFNDLEFLSNLNLQKKMNGFELMLLKDKNFRQKLSDWDSSK